MPQTNGTNGWTKWLVGTLWSVLVLVIMFMGNVVRGNDVWVREELKEVEEHSDARIDKVEEIVTDIRLEQRTLISTVKAIEKKLQ